MQQVLGRTILAGKYEKEKNGRDEKDSTIYLVLCVMIYQVSFPGLGARAQKLTIKDVKFLTS